MALKSGLAAQIAFKAETTYGVHDVSSMKFLPLVNESLSQEIEMLEDAGIIAGRRLPTSDQWDLGAITCGGDVQLELFNTDLSTLFLQMFGAQSTLTFTPGDLDDDSMTIQVGRPGVDGTVYPYTYVGCKVASWEIAVAEGEIATLGLTVVAQREFDWRTVADGVTNTDTSLTSATAAFGPDDVGKPVSGSGIAAGTTIASVTNSTTVVLSAATTATASSVAVVIGVALASASYTSGLKPFKYHHAAITLAGSSFKVKNATVSGDNMLDDARRFLGQRIIDEPHEAGGTRVYEGTLEAEFTSPAAYRRFTNGTEAALVIALNNGDETLTITQNVRFNGETPKVEGADILTQPLPYKAVASSTDASAITAVLSDA